MLRNLAATPQAATLTVEYPSAPGWDSTEGRTNAAARSASSGAAPSPPATPVPSKLTRQAPLTPIVLQGYSTQDILLDSVLGVLSQRIPYGSIRIQLSGKPGSIVAEVASVERSKDLVVDAKLQNEGNAWAGSGAHPWHLDSETESLVFLTDMGDEPARIGFKVWDQGTVYYLTRLKLAKQMAITAYDVVSAPRHHAFEHPVVIRIFLNNVKRFFRLHQMGDAHDPGANHGRVFRRHLELDAELFLQLVEQARRNERVKGFQKGQVKEGAGQAAEHQG